MTKNFDAEVQKLLKEMDVTYVFGNSGEYDTSDNRVPKILGAKRRKRKNKNKCGCRAK